MPVQLRVAVPEFVRVIFWEAGADPDVLEKFNDVGERVMVGAGFITV